MLHHDNAPGNAAISISEFLVQKNICVALVDLIVNRSLIVQLSLYTRLKPTCDEKIGIMGRLYIFNQ